ncbi:TetR/AcrR family transcriptional regulator [Notoacmeibacter sp. MSK16QG-6]|uniref:TetR/AcrR family transcriptional regulator n=1 Tax=Notoacmeibacter sp. MSK16QG-6 TaxID=2957982 RepID=UPI0020A014D5|nr:TetR/AcrR family transcriptional regulator [Notoacmeibacter sp. MSK16QG-6]MCP1198931.1 TetR/AcrR family transcriptional regulator [Notoacmeibacter sp. MSK16QG-6]
MADDKNLGSVGSRWEMLAEAAYALLREKGYRSTSMLAIAKKAGMSNQTLYRLYPNKQALFGALVEANAKKATEFFASAEQEATTDPLAALNRLGPILLELVASERAVALNRAAAGDVHDTARLGPLIAENGREVLWPMVTRTIGLAMAAGDLSSDADPAMAADIWFSVLIGDLQIRRVIGTADPLECEARITRSTLALDILKAAYPPET